MCPPLWRIAYVLCKNHRLKLSAALLRFICEEHFRVLSLRTALKSISLSTVSVFGILRKPEFSRFAVESMKWFSLHGRQFGTVCQLLLYVPFHVEVLLQEIYLRNTPAWVWTAGLFVVVAGWKQLTSEGDWLMHEDQWMKWNVCCLSTKPIMV